jgi:DNA sulfur modification protein DndC
VNTEIDTRTIQMFDASELAGPSLEDRVERARFAIRQLFENHQPVIVAYSSGKDSSVVANMALVEAKHCASQGMKPVVIVTTSDTLIENPSIQQHYRTEHRKMREFAKKAGFKLRTEVVQPSLLMSWQGKVLSGRGLPTFPGTGSDCSYDLKIAPQRAARKRIFHELGLLGMNEPVTLIGTRFDESERRAIKMKARGENPDVPKKNKDGDYVLSPIAIWTTEDVWEYIGYVSAGMWEGFSDMQEVMRIYADGGGTSCAVVSDAIFEGGDKKKKGGCGARFGCHLCQMSVDASLQNMVDFDPKYAYAKPLLKLNKLIRNTRFDWSRRHYVGRTIKAGWLAIEPDTYHPEFLRTLRRCMIQIDYDERKRAAAEGEPPRFQLMPLEMIIAVDAIQNLNGVAKPFEIWSDIRDVENGIRYEVPEVDPVPQTPMPETRFLFVGKDWDTAFGRPVQGLRSSYIEALTEMGSCVPELRELSDGHMVWDIETGKGFSVDEESALLILDFEKDRLIEMHDKWQHSPGGITAGYMWYVSYGVLNLDHSQISFHDEVARRTAWKDMHGLTVDYSIDDLTRRSVRYAEMDDEARKAWAHKATTDGSQTDFLSVLDESLGALEEMVS